MRSGSPKRRIFVRSTTSAMVCGVSTPGDSLSRRMLSCSGAKLRRSLRVTLPGPAVVGKGTVQAPSQQHVLSKENPVHGSSAVVTRVPRTPYSAVFIEEGPLLRVLLVFSQAIQSVSVNLTEPPHHLFNVHQIACEQARYAET